MLNYFRDTKEMEIWKFKMSINFLERIKMVFIDEKTEWKFNRLQYVDAKLFAKLKII